MSCILRISLAIYLLAFQSVALGQRDDEPHVLVAAVVGRGCIKINDLAICAGRSEKVEISHQGILYAGFPPYVTPDETCPLCKIEYNIPNYWADVRFDVSDWCLKGLDGSKVRCCDQKIKYKGIRITSPYYMKKEGASPTGGHSVEWDEAFPDFLSMNTLPPDSKPFVSESWGTLNTGRQTEAFVPGSNVDVATHTAFNLNNNFGPNPVQPVVLGASFGQDPDFEQGTRQGTGQGNALYADFLTAELTAPEPGAGIFGV
ncbi:hypothetical protein MMC07_004501 [Pseudocyphellaria aurata]|nr:hypothetical protein [Pseudocyphellaria aurata]